MMELFKSQKSKSGRKQKQSKKDEIVIYSEKSSLEMSK